MQAQYGYFSPTDPTSGTVSYSGGTAFFGAPGLTHFAIGAFSGSNGLPFGQFDDAGDWEAYAAALLAKTDEFSPAGQGLNMTLSYATTEYLIVGGTAVDVVYADGSVAGRPAATGAGEWYGRGGDDQFRGGTGADLMDGGDGADSLFGGDGDDTIRMGSGLDTVNGSAGADTLDLSDSLGPLVVTAGLTGAYVVAGETRQISNIENILGGGGDDALTGLAGDNRLAGADGADTLVSGGGNDDLDAGDGDDLVRAGAGDQMLAGGLGVDTLSYADLGAGVRLYLSFQGANQDIDNGQGVHVVTGFEALVGSAHDDTLGGTVDADLLEGGAGDDSLTGSDEDDTLKPGGGNDTVVGGNGSDTMDISDLAGPAVIIAGVEDDYSVGADLLYIAGIENIVAGVGDDRLEGVGDANAFWGGGGDDTLISGGGADVLDGGAGADVVWAGVGDQTLKGGGDADVLSYIDGTFGVTVSLEIQDGTTSQATGVGDHVLSGFEHLSGSNHGDTLSGDAAANMIEGGFGADTLNGEGGDDILAGGHGRDQVSYFGAAAGVTVSLADQGAGQTTGVGSQVLSGLEDLRGSTHDDILVGDTGANWIFGGAGDDSIDGGGGNDTLDGGGGVNALSYAGASAGVTVDLKLTGSQVTGVGTQQLSGFATLSGGDHADRLSGDREANLIFGGGGADTLAGRGGDDTLLGAGGADTADFGGAQAVSVDLGLAGSQDTGAGMVHILGVENLVGSARGDRLAGDAAANDIDGGGGADTLVASTGSDTLRGGGGVDLVDLSGFGEAVTIEIPVGRIWTSGPFMEFTGVERFIGTAFADLFVDDDAAWSFEGGDGGDSLLAGLGDDRFVAGLGQDEIDFFDLGAGVRVDLRVSDAQDTLAGVKTIAGVENLWGTAFADVLDGSSAANVLQTRGGADTVNGHGGDDTMRGTDGDGALLSYAGAANAVSMNLGLYGPQVTGVGTQVQSGFQRLLGSSHDDTLSGTDFAETLDGAAGADRIDGGGGNDALRGGFGRDVVAGGDGTDVIVALGDGDRLTGGADADSFVFDRFGGRLLGWITDLEATDEIDLSGAEAAAGFGFLRVAGFSGAAGEFVLRYNAGGDLTRVKFDLDGDGRADHVLTLEGGDHRTFDNFVHGT